MQLSYLRANLHLVLALFLSASPVFAAEHPGGFLNVYNWADYIGENTLDEFEEEYGVKVNYDVYDNSQIVDAKLMAGGSGYDIVMHSVSNAAQLMPIGVFRELDLSLLPNWKNLDPALLEQVAEFDPGNRFGFPYMWGTTGFSYNVGMIEERMPNAPVNSAELVFNPDIVSHFADCGVTLLDSASEVLGTALIYLGYDVNSVLPEQLHEAEQLLRAIRPYIKYFGSSKLLLDLPSQEVCIAHSYSGDYSVANRRATEAGIDIELRLNIPTEGSTMWFDIIYIPADADNVKNAHLFIDFLLRPSVIAETSNYIGYANVNRYATKLVDESISSDPGIYPDEAVLERLSISKALPPKIERKRSRIWTRIKSGL